MEVMFELPGGAAKFGRRTQQKRRGVPDEFRALALKDEFFRKYVQERNIFSPNYKFDETNIAQDIRKVLPIVVARNYYLRRFEGLHVVYNRSRKTHALYTGYPSIVEITEGNPRAILTCVGPLAQEYQDNLQKADGFVQVSQSLQSKAIRRVELLLTSLLQVVPLDLGGFEAGKGLLGLRSTRSDERLKTGFCDDHLRRIT